ncbi:MAG: hypothetical protein ACREFY_18660 [Acetobacteraceae bacterium]
MAFHDGSLLAGPTQTPGKPLSALAAPEDGDVERFRLRRGYFLSADFQQGARDGSTLTPLLGRANGFVCRV